MPGEGEEVGGGRASCPARCLKVQVLENKEGRNEGSRFSQRKDFITWNGLSASY